MKYESTIRTNLNLWCLFKKSFIYHKDGAYVINLDEYKSIWTYWITLYGNGNNGTYCDSFGVEHIPKDIKRFIRNKNIIINIYRMQVYNS